MKVVECMKQNVVSISVNATVREVAALVVNRHIGKILVVDEAGKLVGMVRLRNLLSCVMPSFIQLVKDFSFAHSFGAAASRKPSEDDLSCPVTKLMEEPIFVDETCSLLYAAAIMHQHELIDVPVVNAAGDLIGIASHVDIGAALMKSWIGPSLSEKQENTPEPDKDTT